MNLRRMRKRGDPVGPFVPSEPLPAPAKTRRENGGFDRFGSLSRGGNAGAPSPLPALFHAGGLVLFLAPINYYVVVNQSLLPAARFNASQVARRAETLTRDAAMRQFSCRFSPQDPGRERLDWIRILPAVISSACFRFKSRFLICD